MSWKNILKNEKMYAMVDVYYNSRHPAGKLYKDRGLGYRGKYYNYNLETDSLLDFYEETVENAAKKYNREMHSDYRKTKFTQEELMEIVNTIADEIDRQVESGEIEETKYSSKDRDAAFPEEAQYRRFA